MSEENKAVNGGIQDPGNYRAMSVPFASLDEAQEAWVAFCKGARELRNKFRIKDTLIVADIAVVLEDGREVTAMMTAHNGNSLNKLPLAAFAYGEASEGQKHAVAEMQDTGRKLWAK